MMRKMSNKDAKSEERHYVYLVRCADDSLYCGWTTDLKRRIDAHNGHISGGAKYTRGRRPVTLVYSESFHQKQEAQRIELANCYTEETDAEKVRAYFESERRLKEKNALVVHKTDTSYWELFRSFPPCSGVAMGADRLIALLSGRKSIEPVLPFSIIERPSV